MPTPLAARPANPEPLRRLRVEPGLPADPEPGPMWVTPNEAVGHRSTFRPGPSDTWPLIGTTALVPQVVDAVKLPVIAAGGIMDGRGVIAALALGAEAAQLGTRQGAGASPRGHGAARGGHHGGAGAGGSEVRERLPRWD